MIPATLAATICALIGRPLGSHEPVAVAVSGGPDSLALLLLAHAVFAHRARVLTVDHGFRVESAAEADSVAVYCAELGLPHATLPWTGPKPVGNRQAAARTARYALMRDWCAANGVAWLMTAHHAEDAAETLLLRLARGSGSGGLAGIRARRSLGRGVTLLRPLLGCRKVDLAALVAAHGWTAVDDPGNGNAAYDRTHARALLRDTSWLDPARLAAASAHLADVEAALEWTADLAWESRVAVTGDAIVVDADGLPHDLARRLALRAITKLAPTTVPRGAAIERVLADLAGGSHTTVAGVAIRRGNRGGAAVWHFTVAPPRREP